MQILSGAVGSIDLCCKRKIRIGVLSMYNDAFTTFPIIETKRLKLRQLEMADADAIYEYAKDDEFIFIDGFPCEYEAIKHMVDVCRNEAYNAKSYIRWVVELTVDKNVIGGVYLFEPHGNDVSGRRMEMGIEISRKYWNNGYATEVIQAVSYYGLTVMGLKRVEALVIPENKGSLRAFEKAGFENEGILRNYCHYEVKGNNLRTIVMLSKIPEDLLHSVFSSMKDYSDGAGKTVSVLSIVDNTLSLQRLLRYD